MSPSDIASLEAARVMSSWGEILVWLGVALEVPEAVSLVLAVRKWWIQKRYISGKPERPEGNWVCGLVGVFGLIVLVIGLSLEIPGHAEEIRITDAESRRLTKELRDAVTNAAEANELAGVANERAAVIESKNLVLQTNVNETKAELAETETRLIELRNESSPMDIGDEFSFGLGLKEFPKISVELRSVMDLRAQATGDALHSAFSVAGWQVINQSLIGDIGCDGIAIGYKNGDTNSQAAAYLLLKILTDREVPSTVIEDPYGDVVRGVRTNAIIVAVGSRPRTLNADLIVETAKEKILSNERPKIMNRIGELLSKKFVPGSKELAEAQKEYNSLLEQQRNLDDQELKISSEIDRLIREISRSDSDSHPTNSNESFTGSFSIGGTKFILKKSNVDIRGNRVTVPLQ